MHSKRSDVLRAAAITALGAFGDSRGLEVARAAVGDTEARVRVAAADTLARLGAPDAAKAVEALVADDRTAADGLRLAQIVADEGVAKAAAARAAAAADVRLRLAAVVALGRQTSPLRNDNRADGALHPISRPRSRRCVRARALAERRSDGRPRNDGANGRFAAPRGARAYFARAYLRGEQRAKLDALLTALATSTDPRDQAVATEAQVTLGDISMEDGLSRSDPRVRRAVVMGAMATPSQKTLDRLVRRMVVEPDEATRITLAAGLVGGDRVNALPLAALIERATSGGADAPMAALAIGRRAEEAPGEVLDRLAASGDALLRAHVARGLGASHAPGAVGRLARAYVWETDVDVRRAIVSAIANLDETSTSGRETLELAAALDPDALTRSRARRALAGDRAAGAAEVREVAWIKLTPVETAALPAGETAILVRSDGLAQPIAFDDDGYALVVGVPPGEAHLRLAPRLPAYSPSSP